MPDHLLSALGGPHGVAQLTVDLYRRFETDPGLAATFAGYDLFRIQQHMRDFLVAAVGGTPYDGRHLDEVHRNLGITDTMFNATAAHIAAVLHTHGVPGTEAAQVAATLEQLRTSIVTATTQRVVEDRQRLDAARSFDRFRHLTSVVQFWRSVAETHGGEVEVQPNYVVSLVPAQPIFTGAFVLDPEAAPRVVERFGDQPASLWSPDRATTAALVERGRSVVDRRTAMVAPLAPLTEPESDPDVVVERVDLTELSAGHSPLEGVAGVTTYATADRRSGAIFYRSGTDALVVSLPSRPGSTGLDTEAVLRHALLDLRARGVRTATLPASDTELAIGAALGFAVLDVWDALA